jgi:hypothetical protein
MKLIGGGPSMTMTSIGQIIFIAATMGLFLLFAMVSEENNSTMTRVWGSAIGMAILIHLTF